MIVEDAADAAMHLAVGDVEILVRPLPEAWIMIGIVRVARGLHRGVEIGGILRIGDRRVEIGAAAEPALRAGEEARVHVGRGRSEGRRGGKGGVSKVEFWWVAEHTK